MLSAAVISKMLISRGFCFALNNYSSAALNPVSNFLSFTRCYSRGIRRRPIRVLNPTETAESGNKFNNVTSSAGFDRVLSGNDMVQVKQPANPKKSSLAAFGTKKADFKHEKTVRNDVFKKVQTDRKLNSKKLSDDMLLVKSRKKREKLGKIILEGERLIKDALNAGAQAETIYFSRKELIAELPAPRIRNTELFEVNYKELQVWSELSTSPGIIGIFKTPDATKLELSQRSEIWPITVICDNIRDPGNLGTALRCAAGIGCERIILTKGCVDAWDPKVLRSGAGAHFRIPVINDLEWEHVTNFIADSATVVLADSAQRDTVKPGDDSLRNLIATREKELGPTELVEVEVNETERNMSKRNVAFSDEKLLKLYRKVDIPRAVYSELEIIDSSPLILVIGGETHGLSGAAHKLACDYGGYKAFIPLANGVDSLNSGVALGIIGYELRRKLAQLQISQSVIGV